MIGRIIGIVVMGTIGLILTIFGCLIWKKKKITLLHDYHVEKVSPENRGAFCKLSGIGILIIGVSLVITAVLLGFTDSAASFISFAAGFIAGLSMLIIAGMKYNR